MRRLFLLLCGLALSGCGTIFSSSGGSTVVIAPDEIGVLINTFNGDIIGTLQPGTHDLLPDNAVTIYSTLPQSYTMPASGIVGTPAPEDPVEGRTLDGQSILVDVTVVYHIDPDNVIEFYTRIGDEGSTYPVGVAFVRPFTRFVIRDLVATYNAEDFYTERRLNFTEEVRISLEPAFTEIGLILDDVILSDIRFSAVFEAQMMITMTYEAPHHTSTPIPRP